MRASLHRTLLGMLFLTGCIGAGTALRAAPPEWAATPYEYVVLDQDMRAVLTEFGRNLGISVSLSDAVKGRVRGRVEAENAGAFLEALTSANGLNWYFDGAVLHISAASEYATRVIPAGRLQGQAVAQEMQALGLADDRFSLRESGDGSVISASGPPAYLATVQEFVRNMQPAPAPNGDDPRVRVYRGRGGSDEVTSAALRRDDAPDASSNPPSSP